MKKIKLLVLLMLISSNSFGDITKLIDACLEGDPDSCDNVAGAYEEGDGVDKDFNTSYEYFFKACNLGSGYGCRWLGIYRDPEFDEYNVKKSYESAFNSYTKGCGLEDSVACYYMALAYEYGEGVKVDLTAARKYHLQACVDMDIGGACTHLGDLYDAGQGGEIDKAMAKKYYKIGCDDFAEDRSCFNLGVLYYNADGTKKDELKSMVYFAKACVLGDSDGCDELE